MNLFRSEEHLGNWALYDPANAEGTMPLKDYASLFATRMFRERLAPDYVLRLPEFGPEWVAVLVQLGKTGSFWRPRPA